jgi:hypothetical protein
MAKELEALKNRKHDDTGSRPADSPDMAGTTQDSPDHPANLSGTATVDLVRLDTNAFELDNCVISRETVIEVFQL